MGEKLCYRTPAKKFSEALPIGNGSLGAMVYGDFPNFHYSLNADTLWSGCPKGKKSVVVKKEVQDKVKALLKAERYKEADRTVQKCMVGNQYNESYVSAGFLNLKFMDELEQNSFYRELSLDSACEKTEIYTIGGKIQIESFVSGQDNVLITHIDADKPISLEITLSSLLRFSCQCRNQEVTLLGEAPSHVEPNYVDIDEGVVYGNGMKYIILTKTVCDGDVEVINSILQIKNATEVTLYTVICTGFRGYDCCMEDDYNILRAECIKILEKSMRHTYVEIKKRHIQAHKYLYDRVSLRINDSMNMNHWYEMLFQYGRYLMICSSRQNNSYSQPSNLQGIWCEDIRSVWSSNYTVNINTEMNYWISGMGALSECDKPLIHMIEDIAKAGKRTAKEMANSDGWIACHNVDIWRQTTPVEGEAKWAYWPMGGVWLTTHLYQHYLYTNDEEFLKEEAYPIMKDTAKFCMSWLYEEDGVWYTSPNTSPENTFYNETGEVCCISRNVTMDHALIREVLSNTLEVGILLGEKKDFIKKLEMTISCLPEYQVGAQGQLLEWEKDFAEVDVNHRHFAHLVGFHPFHQIDFENRSDLLPAVKQVLKRRTEGMKYKIGWNEAWLTNFYARLHDGNSAKEHLDAFLSDCTYPNLMGLHPPLGESVGEREIFQIDGNFGIAAGIGEMLLQGKKGYISFLPALPEEWEKGEIKGMIVPGGHIVDISWNNGVLEHARIVGASDNPITIVYKCPFRVFDEQGGTAESIFNRKSENKIDYRVTVPLKEHLLYEIRIM